MNTRLVKLGCYGLPLAFLAVVAGAGSQRGASPEDLVRRANAAFLAGDRDAADDLYAAAEERTADPGLVAFNRAAVLFQRDDYRGAEEHYARVLEDAACPPDRAARAWFNRGTCLLRRGGAAGVFRSAIACLERCADSPAADAPLRADARHNLEIAKSLWNDARNAERKKDTPNDTPPREDPRNEPPPKPPGPEERRPGEPETGDANTGQRTTGPVPQPNGSPTAATQPQPDDAATPGTSAAPQLKDDVAVQALSPEDTREHLRRTAERIRKDRRTLLRTIYPPEQPDVRDW